jgi:hypothetical protein
MPRVDDLAGLHVKARSEANCRFGPVAVGPLAKFVRGQWLGDHQHILRRPGGDHVEIDSLELKVNWRLMNEFSERWALGAETVRLRTSLTPGRSIRLLGDRTDRCLSVYSLVRLARRLHRFL